MGKKNKKRNLITEWEEQIKVFPRLSIEEAKEKYLEAIHISDELQKKKILNEVIQGTLYVIVNFVKSNKLNNIRNAGYNTDDIINTCNELWIKAIYDGELLEVDAFSKILNPTFCAKLAPILNETDFGPIDLTVFTADNFVWVLYEFINYESQFGEISFKDFCRLIARYYDMDEDNYYPVLWSRMNELGFSDSDFTKQTYELFQNIVSAIKDENGDILISKTKIDKFKYLLIEAGLQEFRINMNLVSEGDFSDRSVDNIIFSQFIKDVFENSELDDRKKDLLNRFFGLNGFIKQDVEVIANIHRISTARAYQLRNKALKSLRKNPKILKYYQFYKEQQ